MSAENNHEQIQQFCMANFSSPVIFIVAVVSTPFLMNVNGKRNFEFANPNLQSHITHKNHVQECCISSLEHAILKKIDTFLLHEN